MGLDYSKIEDILSKIRTVKYGDYVLAEDHNYQTDAIKELLNLIKQLESQVGAGNLSDLGDVEITEPKHNQKLYYDGGKSKWVNSYPALNPITPPDRYLCLIWLE